MPGMAKYMRRFMQKWMECAMAKTQFLGWAEYAPVSGHTPFPCILSFEPLLFPLSEETSGVQLTTTGSGKVKRSGTQLTMS